LGPAVERVVGFVVGQQPGDVALDRRHGASALQPRDERAVARGAVVAATDQPQRRRGSRQQELVLDRDRDAGQEALPGARLGGAHPPGDSVEDRIDAAYPM
jgi:hypothetical protein